MSAGLKFTVDLSCNLFSGGVSEFQLSWPYKMPKINSVFGEEVAPLKTQFVTKFVEE